MLSCHWQEVLRQPSRILRLGILGIYPSMPYEAFEQILRRRGWDNGRNLVIERRYTRRQDHLFMSFAKELVDARSDVILTSGDAASLAAFGATRSIPIVATVTDPVALGLAKSLARPGGNVTGVVYQADEYAGKQVDLLRAIRSNLRRIGIVFVPNHVAFNSIFTSWKVAADRIGAAIVKLPHPVLMSDIDATLVAARQERVQAVDFSLNVALRGAGWRQINAWAIEHKVLTSAAEYAGGEAMVAFGANGARFVNQVVDQINFVLRGAKPAELPIQQPTVFDLIINRRLVNAIGLTVPHSVLVQATEVID